MKHFKRAFILFLALSLIFLVGCEPQELDYLKAPNETQQLFYYSDFNELSQFCASENGAFFSDYSNNIYQLPTGDRNLRLLASEENFAYNHYLYNYFNYNNELYFAVKEIQYSYNGFYDCEPERDFEEYNEPVETWDDNTVIYRLDKNSVTGTKVFSDIGIKSWFVYGNRIYYLQCGTADNDNLTSVKYYDISTKENKELFSKEYIHSFGIVNGNIRFAIEKENYNYSFKEYNFLDGEVKDIYEFEKPGGLSPTSSAKICYSQKFTSVLYSDEYEVYFYSEDANAIFTVRSNVKLTSVFTCNNKAYGLGYGNVKIARDEYGNLDTNDDTATTALSLNNKYVIYEIDLISGEIKEIYKTRNEIENIYPVNDNLLYFKEYKNSIFNLGTNIYKLENGKTPKKINW